MITTFYPPYNFGGDGIFVHRLSNELAQRGHQVGVSHCIDSYRMLEGREPACGYEDHPNVTVHGLQSRWGFLSPLATQQTGFPLFKSARIERILERGFASSITTTFPSSAGPKFSNTVAASNFTQCTNTGWCPTHGLFRCNRAVCLQPQCFLCSLIYRRPPQWWRYGNLLKTAVKHVDAFIAPSHLVMDKHQDLGLDIPIIHLPNFVPRMDASTTTPEAGPRGDFWRSINGVFVGWDSP